MYNVFRRMMHSSQKGITGLETAIIMIAFVIVASVFAYVVISSGLFATQKSQEAINKGIDTASGAIVLKGGVLGICQHFGAGGYVSQMTFTLTNEMGGAAVDFTIPSINPLNNGTANPGGDNKVVISYLDPYQKVDNLFWTVDWLGANNGDNLLDGGEMVQVTIGSDIANLNGGNLADALTHHLAENTKFSLQIASASGSVLGFERTTPGYIDRTIDLH